MRKKYKKVQTEKLIAEISVQQIETAEATEESCVFFYMRISSKECNLTQLNPTQFNLFNLRYLDFASCLAYSIVRNLLYSEITIFLLI